MRILTYLIAQPRAVALACLALVALGLLAGRSLSVDLLPHLDVPLVNVITQLPGSSSADVELLVTRPLEDALRVAPSVHRVQSTSLPGVSLVTVQFHWGVHAADARQIVLGRLGQAGARLPQGIVPRLGTVSTTLQQVAGWALYGPGDPVELALVARRQLASALTGLRGVERVEVLGGERRAFWVSVDPERLAAAQVSLGAVGRAVGAGVGVRFGGFLRRGAEELSVRGDARPGSVAELAGLPVAAPGLGFVPLGELAQVRSGYAPRHDSIREDGQAAVALLVYKQRGASALAVSRELRAAMQRLSVSLPPGTQSRLFYDQADVLTSIRDGFAFDLSLGTVLASLTVALLLGGVRGTSAVVATIPLALLPTLGLLWALGLSLDAVTVSALTLAIGMVVDDAVVVTEIVRLQRERGASPRSASLRGVTEILGPDFSGTLTTIAAYLPILLVGGLAGLFLRPFAITVVAALVFSFLLSVSVVPAFLAWRAGGEGRERSPLHALLERLRLLLRRVLAASCARRRRVLGLTALATLLGAAPPVLRHGPISLLPQVDEGALLVEYVLPPGVSLAESERIGALVESRIRDLPGVRTTFRRIGSPAGSLQIEGINRGELLVRLTPPGSARPSAVALLERLRSDLADIPGAVVFLRQPTQEKIDESFSGLPALFGVTLYGPSSGVLRSFAARAAQILRSVPGIRGVVDPTLLERPELVIHLSPGRAAAMGIEPSEALGTIQALGWGWEVGRIVRDREDIPLLLRVRGLSSGVDGVRALPLVTAQGRLVPLSSVADVSVQRVPAARSRLNGSRIATLLADVEGNLPAIARAARRQLAQLRLPPGYAAEVSGQYPELLRLAEELVAALLGAAALIFAILWLHFGSARLAGWLAAAAPISLAGAILALSVTQASLDVGVAAAALTLIGVSVNNGIVVADFARRRVLAGESPRRAATEAAALRMRPILLTSLTTVAALLPAALAVAPGQHFFHSFAIAVIGGMLSGTAGSLLVLPIGMARSLPAPPRTKAPSEAFGHPGGAPGSRGPRLARS